MNVSLKRASSLVRSLSLALALFSSSLFAIIAGSKDKGMSCLQPLDKVRRAMWTDKDGGIHSQAKGPPAPVAKVALLLNHQQL